VARRRVGDRPGPATVSEKSPSRRTPDGNRSWSVRVTDRFGPASLRTDLAATSCDAVRAAP